MKIKQLEWVRRYSYIEAEIGFSSSYVVQMYWDGTVQLTLGSKILGTYKNKGYEEAKAAAQADFEKRVMACFETTDKSNFWG